MSETMVPTFEAALPPLEMTRFQREQVAFRRLLPQLLATHRGLHVAVHGEQVIDHDADDIALIRRVYAKVGYVPIYVGLITDTPAVVRIPHYREIGPQGGA